MSVILCSAQPADAAAILAIYRPFVTDSPVSFETVVPSVDEMRMRIEKALRNWAYLVARDGDQVLGYAYATQLRERAAYQWSCETSVYLAPQAQGRGIARQLYEALLPKLQAQGFCNAFAAIALPNDPSVRLHEAVGFVACGRLPMAGWKLGAWHDIGWWHKALRPTPGAAPVPRAILA